MPDHIGHLPPGGPRPASAAILRQPPDKGLRARTIAEIITVLQGNQMEDAADVVREWAGKGGEPSDDDTTDHPGNSDPQGGRDKIQQAP